jgi:hypothetical protein
MCSVIVERLSHRERQCVLTSYEGDGLMLSTVRELKEFVADKIDIDPDNIGYVGVHETDDAPSRAWCEFVINR